MKKFVEIVMKSQNDRHHKILEKHKKIIDQYAVPCPETRRKHWVIYYEQIIAREEERARVLEKHRLDNQKEVKAEVTSQVNIVTSNPSYVQPQLTVVSNNDDLPNQPDLIGALAHYKFIHFW